MTPEPLTVANRYRLLERLGKGGMGEVWKAQDLTFENLCVAIKLLNEDDTRSRDAGSRRRLERDLRKESPSDRLSVETIVRLMRAALGTSRGSDKIRARVVAHAPDGVVSAEGALALYDECADDPDCSDSAKQRSDLHMRFKREANTLASLTHPNIVRVSNFNDGQNGIVPFLVMDYIDGETVAAVVKRDDPMPLDRKLELMEGLCAGLAYAHRKGVVHRDIKPLNLIIEDSTGTLKIVDFGVVRRLDQKTETSMGVVVGTFRYMSPEQISGSAALDGRSDIFSAGLVVYEVVTGEAAFAPRENESLHEVVTRIREETPRPIREIRPNLPADLEPILAKALAKDPANRYQDADVMRQDLAVVRSALARVQIEKTMVLDLGPRVQELAEAARRARADGRLTDAVAALTEACGLDPSRRDLAADLAAVRQEAAQAATVRSILTEVDARVAAGDLDTAIGMLERAPGGFAELSTRKADLDRERRVRALLAEARTARHAERFGEAIGRYEEAGRLGSGRPDIGRELAETMAEEQAAAARRAAVDLANTIRTLASDASVAEAAGRHDEAIEKLEEACRLAPDRPDLAQQLKVTRQHQQALADRQAAERQADLLIGQADAFARQGRKGRDRAIAWLGSQASTHPRVVARLTALNEERLRDLASHQPAPERAWWQSRVTIATAAAVVVVGAGWFVVRGLRPASSQPAGTVQQPPAAGVTARASNAPIPSGPVQTSQVAPGVSPSPSAPAGAGKAPAGTPDGIAREAGQETETSKPSTGDRPRVPSRDLSLPGSSSNSASGGPKPSGPTPSENILKQARVYVDANEDETAVKYLSGAGRPYLGDNGFGFLIQRLVERAKASASSARDLLKSLGVPADAYAAATSRFDKASGDASAADPLVKLTSVAEFNDAKSGFDAAAAVDSTFRGLRDRVASGENVGSTLQDLLKAKADHPQDARFADLLETFATRTRKQATDARDAVPQPYQALDDFKNGLASLDKAKAEPAAQAIPDLDAARVDFSRVSRLADDDQAAIKKVVSQDLPACYQQLSIGCLTGLYAAGKAPNRNTFNGVRSWQETSSCGGASVPSPTRATVECDRTVTQTTDRGPAPPQLIKTTFSMQKVDGAWKIQSTANGEIKR